ncbi:MULTISPECIES: LysR family transcriptional regulator [unclassified Herbaspirillum]|uniref:LysR family transcriptional regulator n=1 Tax=unclassified Herbaspirillum TaxID=2624150 RepID=UPI00115320B3|nr:MULTISPECIES: LysR family transcriptional regulator [unclassified Herbaspirillum]MBB5392458.1 DNA-binding transcriptional LysR family regulator [Herbaspirillum sp. SJZ102]TQK06097.1 LysR family transcriptional regulator [Herbaspirillum sp. SJZ130]TQK12425.1 LysR family transcriptional regulator [Herbaspirillum sp. SJZ106]
MNKLREIECFIAVAELGSFVKAADALGISKAAVSRTVLELEARLGSRLMQRTTRRLSLTEAGTLYLERCKQIVAALEEADDLLLAGAANPGGLLRINAPHTFGVLHLAPLWPMFLERYPGVALDITLSDRIVDIIDEGFDMAIRIARLSDSTLVHRKLASTGLLVCASPDYLDKHGTPTHPHELAQHQAISYSYNTGKDDWQFNGPEGPVSVKVRSRMHVNNGDSCVAAALGGAGITRQPTFMIDQHLRSGRLVPLLTEYSAPELGIYAVYPSRAHLPPKVRAMLDFLSEAFKQVHWDD